MTKLDELIKELCPNGVEYRTLGEVAKVTSGSSAPQASSDFSKNGIPFCRTSDVGKIHLSVDFNEIADRITETAARKMNLMPKGTILIPKSGASTLLNHKVRLSIDSYVVSHLAAVIPNKKIINDRFLYYVLTCFDMCQLVEDKSYPSVKTSDIASKIQIPVPPLPVQEEIVRILDSFTSLTAELTAELTARRKQYEYYRDALLSFKNSNGGGDEVKFRKLREIATVTKLAGFEFTKYVHYSDSGNIIALRGLNVKNGQLNLNDVKYIDESDFSKLTRSKLYINDMLFTYVGTVGQVALVDKNDKYYLAPNVALIRFEDKTVYPPYMKYYFQTSYFKKNQIDRYSGESSMKNLTMENIRKFEIPLPPLSVQQRIVNVLDNFDAICSDLKIGLPAEIDARKKQYEYYRDLLLTFAERGNTIRTEQNRTDEIKLLQYVFGYAVVRLGEIGELCAGATPSTSKPEYWENGTISWMSSGEVNLGQVYQTEKKITKKGFENCSTKMVPKNTVVVALAGQGKTRGTVAITRISLCTNQSLCSILTKDFVDSYYLYFYLKSQYQRLRAISSGEGTRGGLSLRILRDFELPLPPLSVQQRIVKILDRFDSLCNDISSGIPAEIEARKKQYEYYRDKLLSFPHCS